MDLKTLVEYCDEWNAANDPDYAKKSKGIQRKATQYDWNILLG